MKPIVSVIIPTYNDEKLGDCLKTVRSQNFPLNKYEIIVVDNNSNKSYVAAITKKLRISYLLEPRKGAYFARNKGLLHSKGNFILFTDSDCKLDPNWIREMIKPFQDNKTGIVGGVIRKTKPTNIIERNTECLAEGQISPRMKTFYSLPYVIGASMGFRREVILKLNGFDESFTSGGDVDMCWRVQLAGYKLRIAEKAIIYHNSRTTLSEYYTQYMRYGIGHAHLFEKYFNGRLKIQIDYKNQWILTKSIFLFIFYSIVNIVRKNELYEKNLLQAIRSIGLIRGRIKGSLRHKIIYI